MLKRIFLIILISSVASAAKADISIRVCRADGNTPLEIIDPCSRIYRPIMVGTHLTIIVNSDANGYWDGGELSIWDTNRYYGILSGRDYNDETHDWKGSRFPAAGDTAIVWDFVEPEIVDEQAHDANGFRFSGEDNAIAGDWFIVDYNAIGEGPCSVIFYDFTLDWWHPQYEMFFTQVPTRDFDGDGIVDFIDFAIFGSNWQRTDCVEPINCAGTDLDTDSDVDYTDLNLFADFWLESTG